MNKSSTGLNENIAGLLCYLLGWITGLVFFLIEKDSKFVKFHALQSILMSIALIVVSIVLSFIPVVGNYISLLFLILWIFMMFKAFQGQKFKLPIIGDIADKKVG